MANKISRRAFLEKSTKGLVATALIPPFLASNVGQALSPAKGGNMQLSEYLEHFGVDEKLMNEVMSEALSRGGDYCDLFFEHTISNYIGLEDKAVNRAYSSVAFGVGIRVLKGDQSGYSFTEEITPKAMKQAAKTAANIANLSGAFKPVQFKTSDLANHYPIVTPWEQVGINTKIPILQKINDKVFELDKRIIKSSINFSNETKYILIANSDGVLQYDCMPMGLIYVNCNAEQNKRREENYFGQSFRKGLEFMPPEKIDYMATEAVRRTVELFEAVKPEAGEMPVILAAGESGILLHEAIGHGMEADFNRKGVSIFADKIGKPVAQEFITIVDDGTNPNVRGSINVDDEGTPSQKTFLVENGILKSYLHDRISAQYYKTQPTGNGRRQSFRFSPQPRMRNTYMLNGPHKKEEIIQSTKKGIYAESFTNGEVRVGAGDFTFYVKSGYLVEDGKLTRPIKDVNIIGNGPKVLADIVMAADDSKLTEGGGTCGKNGQGVPVSMGLPTVKVSKITVGGVKS